MSTFPARYPGRCPECDSGISEGDVITMTDDGAVHAECMIPSLRRRDPDPCPACWLVHPAGACDR